MFEIGDKDIVETKIDKIIDAKVEETQVTHISAGPSSRLHHMTYENDEDEIMAWEDKDPENPYNWSGLKKNRIVLTTMMLIVNSTMGSALPSNALSFIAAEWQVDSEQQMVLPISVYLIGWSEAPDDK